jgi:hypothetical protein
MSSATSIGDIFREDINTSLLLAAQELFPSCGMYSSNLLFSTFCLSMKQAF